MTTALDAPVYGHFIVGKHSEYPELYHIDRGYEHIDEKLLLLGANVERVKDR